MALLVRPLLGRVSTAYDEAGRVPGGWIAAIFAGVLLSAYATEEIGIARDLRRVHHGHGHAAPRGADRGRDAPDRGLRRRSLLLPLFFAYTGLRTNIGLLDRPDAVADHAAC